ncbi:YhdH/YhfP family quinone oxidoreductase [Pararcticibacter amylolyticus]|uniref:Oxidoreductase n=1 Tax=Pararcticibacter amylolyticus TaxID=2173175 RepID=A0A2U2PIY6_9SPHI|nr:YhdH/YhfP family quinone oxidoreductase [Pararcticibacter amylolyticus]PWG81351.1 oxidoreductase [Pararcticibacter amylolyticus]
MTKRFKGYRVVQDGDRFYGEISELTTDSLKAGEVLIKVAYSSLNYKDALSASGNKGVTKNYPHVPGIDAAGVVVFCGDGTFSTGQEVIVTGFDLGMNTWGGFAEYVRVPSSWVIELPHALSLKEAMCFGTAGLTAGLSVHKILSSAILAKGESIAVSGVSGGVGSIAASILLKLGYQVTGISGGKNDDFLHNVIGLEQIISREDFINTYNTKALSPQRFAAGVDAVGGEILSGMIKSLAYNGIVSCCGNVSGHGLDTSIYPFILRGVQLSGIDSVNASVGLRKIIWEMLSSEWKPDNLQELCEEISLEQLPEKLHLMLSGGARGRYVLKHDPS